MKEFELNKFRLEMKERDWRSDSSGELRFYEDGLLVGYLDPKPNRTAPAGTLLGISDERGLRFWNFATDEERLLDYNHSMRSDDGRRFEGGFTFGAGPYCHLNEEHLADGFIQSIPRLRELFSKKKFQEAYALAEQLDRFSVKEITHGRRFDDTYNRGKNHHTIATRCTLILQ